MRSIIIIILTYLIILLAIAFFTLLERKFLGYIQLRKGPNKISLIGLPLPFADAIKLFCKEYSFIYNSNTLIFIISPILRLIIAIFIWILYPTLHPNFFFSFGSLLFICISRISIYPLILSGWASNSKYALIGAIRRIAQTVSYEVRIAFIILRILIIFISFNLTNINLTHNIPIFLIFPFLFIIWFSTALAETNRTPFDLSEGESELVSGFNIEYRRNRFAFIFIAEYTNILIISLFSSIFFLNTYIHIFQDLFISWKIIIISLLFIWIRGTFPRIRYDSLINLTWKCFLPISITTIIFSSSLLFFI